VSRAQVGGPGSDIFTCMEVLGRIRLSLWVVVMGAIVLYVFFASLASVAPAEVAGLTSVVAALAIVLTIRNLRVAGEIADPGGDPQLRRDVNRIRERRGF
jgi:hypothetical protein